MADRDDTSSLEEARERLYRAGTALPLRRSPFKANGRGALPHDWGDTLAPAIAKRKRHVRRASLFLAFSFIFFLVTLGVAGYALYFGGNSVSTDKIDIAVQGPSTIASGDMVPLSIVVTNTNAVPVENATLEVDFPDGTRSASDATTAFPRYTENLGELAPGASVTRSVKAMLFGGAGQALSLPISLSYGTAASNATFVKKTSYSIEVSSAPLSVSVDAPADVVSGTPVMLTFSVRSSAPVSLDNVVLAVTTPFGFSVSSSSVPMSGGSFLLGTFAPGESRDVMLTGTLYGQDSEQKVFHATIGTAQTAQGNTPSVAYMTQDTTVSILAPFITTTVAIGGDTSDQPVLQAGTVQNITVSYTNTLPTSIANAAVSVTLSGNAIDYSSIKTAQGFYRSSDHTIIFDKDHDASLASLAANTSGTESFTFSTLPSGALPPSPTITFATAVSGTPVGGSGTPESMKASETKTAKVETTVLLGASSLHAAGIAPSGPIPPKADQATTYTIVWNATDEGSAVAGATVTATLPDYVSYTGETSGAGTMSYDGGSRTVTWTAGNLPQGGSAQGSFQVSLTPSASQKGSAPTLTGPASFSGYDRFAGVEVTATAGAATTETTGDPGYVPADALVQ